MERAQEAAESHPFALLSRLLEFLECRQNPHAGFLHLPADGNRESTVATHYPHQLLRGIHFELAYELLNVGLADAEEPREFA